MDRFENLRFRVCCVFGCSLFSSKGAPKHTRKRNTPKNADSRNGPLPAFSSVLRFRVCFGACQFNSSLCCLLRKFWRFQARDSGNCAIHDSQFCAVKGLPSCAHTSVHESAREGCLLCQSPTKKEPLNGGVSNGGVSRSGLVLPFLSFFVLFRERFFWDFPDLLGDGLGIFPICPFPLSRPIKSTYEEQSRKGPRHNLDLARKSGKHPGLETPRFSFSQTNKGSYVSAHVSTHARAHTSVHERFWSKFTWSVFACSAPYLTSDFLHYHPFQNHYMHEIIVYELVRGLQLQLSGVLWIN